MKESKKLPLKFELMFDERWGKTYVMIDRLKVFGGWIVSRHTMMGDALNTDSNFVPDQNHEWEISEDE